MVPIISLERDTHGRPDPFPDRPKKVIIADTPDKDGTYPTISEDHSIRIEMNPPVNRRKKNAKVVAISSTLFDSPSRRTKYPTPKRRIIYVNPKTNIGSTSINKDEYIRIKLKQNQ